MACQRCGSVRLVRIMGKCSDCFVMWADGKEYEGYVPGDMGIGGGDEVEFTYCLECGQIQDSFPVADPDKYFNGEYEEEDE